MPNSVSGSERTLERPQEFEEGSGGVEEPLKSSNDDVFGLGRKGRALGGILTNSYQKSYKGVAFLISPTPKEAVLEAKSPLIRSLRKA